MWYGAASVKKQSIEIRIVSEIVLLSCTGSSVVTRTLINTRIPTNLCLFDHLDFSLNQASAEEPTKNFRRSTSRPNFGTASNSPVREFFVWVEDIRRVAHSQNKYESQMIDTPHKWEKIRKRHTSSWSTAWWEMRCHRSYMRHACVVVHTEPMFGQSPAMRDRNDQLNRNEQLNYRAWALELRLDFAVQIRDWSYMTTRIKISRVMEI